MQLFSHDLSVPKLWARNLLNGYYVELRILLCDFLVFVGYYVRSTSTSEAVKTVVFEHHTVTTVFSYGKPFTGRVEREYARQSELYNEQNPKS